MCGFSAVTSISDCSISDWIRLVFGVMPATQFSLKLSQASAISLADCSRL